MNGVNFQSKPPEGFTNFEEYPKGTFMVIDELNKVSKNTMNMIMEKVLKKEKNNNGQNDRF